MLGLGWSISVELDRYVDLSEHVYEAQLCH